MKAQATNGFTGEVLELECGNYRELVAAWQHVSEMERVAKALRDQLKELVPLYIDSKGVSEPINGRMFRQSAIQRMTYDKAILRKELDEDTYDLLVIPDKTAVDKFLKENLDQLGEKSTEIRRSMVAVGKPYTVLKLEKVS